MANFSPAVGGRGLIGVGRAGIVLRPTYHVFDLLRHRMGRTVVDSYQPSAPRFTAGTVEVEALDAVCTLDDHGRTAACLVNRCENQPLQVEMQGLPPRAATLYTISGDAAESYNDFDAPDRVAIRQTAVGPGQELLLAPHSVSVFLA
jgi:alpha-L-arabinofuranosidase